MKFESRTFSKRFAPQECVVFVMHEPDGTPFRATGAALILRSGAAYVGIAVCSPADRFIRSVGHAKAVGRAFSETLLPTIARKPDLFVNIETPDYIHIKSVIEYLIAERKKDCGIYGFPRLL